MKRQLKQSGQAMVEFAVLMIVFIPLLTYGFFVMDLGHHLLDVQETVIATTWDYTSATYEGSSSNKTKLSQNLANIFHAGRFEYTDHTSAVDDFGHINDTNDEKKYHYEMGSKAAWVDKDSAGRSPSDPMQQESKFQSDYPGTTSSQVICALDNTADLKWILLGSMEAAYGFGTDDSYNRGGVVTCWARLHVYNYVIPDKFMQEHASVDMTKQKIQSRGTQSAGQGSVTDVEGLSSAAAPVTLRDHAALSFGTWAINNGDTSITGPSYKSKPKDGDLDYCPSASNPFYSRVAWVYSGGGLAGFNQVALAYKVVYGAIGTFAAQAASKVEIVTPIPVMPDTTDGSPEGFECPTFAAIESMAGRPANPAGVNLTARHERGSGYGNYLKQTKASTMDFIAGEPGFETTPYQLGNNKYRQAYQARGPYYMGATSDTP